MKSERRRLGVFLLTLPFFAMAGAAIVAAAAPPTVSQFNRQFSPGVLHIEAGTTVHIVNDDNVTHHVYVDAPGMQFDSGEQPVGKTVDLTFDKPGTYSVRCAIHPTMLLKVTVK
jgi:plastocyanin